MANKNSYDRDRVNTKRPKKRLRLIAIIVIIVILGLSFWFIKQYYSVDKQLVAVEAAHAITDSENAATIYNKLLKKSI